MFRRSQGEEIREAQVVIQNGRNIVGVYNWIGFCDDAMGYLSSEAGTAQDGCDFLTNTKLLKDQTKV